MIKKRSEDNKNHHIPYRNSALTKMLKTSLKGNSRTFIVICAVPTLTNYENTINSIRFG